MNEKKLLEIIALIGLFFAGIAYIFYASFVTYKIWNWVMPLAFGAPVLGYWMVFALRILVQCFNPRNLAKSTKTPAEHWSDITTMTIAYTVSLGIVWLIAG